MSIAEKLKTIAENEQRVFDAGHNSGYNDGYENGYNTGEQRGYDDGKQAEYDAFWDAFQDYGNRQSYSHAFTGEYWGETIKVKYPIKVTNAYMMFNGNTTITDTDEWQAARNMVIDWSENGSAAYIYRDCGSGLQRIGTVGGRTFSYAFYALYGLHTIDTLILTEGSQYFEESFSYSTALKNINNIVGTIRAKCSFSSCPLEHDSLIRILNALYDYSDEGGSYTLTLGTKNLPKLTDAEKAIATQKGWTLA